MTTFHLGDILTLVLGRQLSPSAPGLSAVNALADHVHGHRMSWAEMGGGALAVAAEHLRAEFPALAELRLPDGANRAEWLAAQVARFGEWHEVTPIRTTDLALTATSKE